MRLRVLRFETSIVRRRYGVLRQGGNLIGLESEKADQLTKLPSKPATPSSIWSILAMPTMANASA